jgi:hypothetical protein
MRIRLAGALLLYLVLPSVAQESCTTAGRFKTCVVVDGLGTRTTVTDLQATQKVGGKVQNLESTQIAFNDVTKDETYALAMMGSFMMLVLPSSTQEQRADILDRMLKFRNSDVNAYGWNWSISNGAGPRGLIFKAAKAR